ncbi:MAG: urea ABC transporter permease subunit UrtB [Rhodospirillales bacterium]|nr:urea ABC transporter permease subunit UrtB [Rhodospirillales bacterium]
MLGTLMLAGLTLIGLPSVAAADEFADLVAKLGADSFADKAEAAGALGALGDGRAIGALKALNDGRLSVTGDKRLVIVDGKRLVDPVIAADLGDAPGDGLERVRVNNRLRGAIAAALSKLQIFSPDRAERLAAARNALKHGSAETVAVLERALASEKDAEVRETIRLSLNGARLNFGSDAEKIAAIGELSGSTDPQIRALLGQLRNAPDLDPAMRARVEAALADIERRLRLTGYAANLFQGVSLGSVLLLAAIGLAITFGVMGVINMAHGEMIMLGAYSAYVVQEVFRAALPAGWIDAYLLVAIPVGFLAAAAFGVAIERSVIRFLYGRPLETLLATWGISLILQQLVRTVFGAPNKEVANPAWMTGGFQVAGGFDVTWNRVYIVVFCFAVLGVVALVLRYTSFGLHMRAVTQNRDMASAMGIPTARVDALTFGLGSGIAGMAGVALSQIGNVSPNLGGQIRLLRHSGAGTRSRVGLCGDS